MRSTVNAAEYARTGSAPDIKGGTCSCEGGVAVNLSCFNIDNMTEDEPFLVLPTGDDQPTVAALDWEGDQVRWVTVEPDWAEKVSPAGLLAQVVETYRKAQPPPENWRLQVDLGDVALEDMKEFALLMKEARASDPVVHAEPLEVKSQHLVSVWAPNGYLVRISDAHYWLGDAPRQTLCEELTAVLQRPEECKTMVTTRAVRRLLDFVGKGKK